MKYLPGSLCGPQSFVTRHNKKGGGGEGLLALRFGVIIDRLLQVVSGEGKRGRVSVQKWLHLFWFLDRYYCHSTLLYFTYCKEEFQYILIQKRHSHIPCKLWVMTCLCMHA